MISSQYTQTKKKKKNLEQEDKAFRINQKPNLRISTKLKHDILMYFHNQLLYKTPKKKKVKRTSKYISTLN